MSQYPIFTLVFWTAALERALKTAAQFVISAWGLATFVVGEGPVPNALEFDWKLALGSALAGFIISILFSLVSAPFGPSGSPSLVVDKDNVVYPDAA